MITDMEEAILLQCSRDNGIHESDVIKIIIWLDILCIEWMIL